MEDGQENQRALEIAEEFETESDRSVAILAVAYLDNLLAILLTNEFSGEKENIKTLMDPGSPLGSFVTRVRLSYALGLLSTDDFEDLKTVARIWNEFAHASRPASFEDSEVSKLCKKLHRSKIDGQPSKARDCYRKTCIRIIVELMEEIDQECE